MLGEVIKKGGLGKRSTKKQWRCSPEVAEVLAKISSTLNMSETDFLNHMIHESGKSLESYFETSELLEKEKNNKGFTLNLYTDKKFIGLEPVGAYPNQQWHNRYEEKRISIQNSYTNPNFKYWVSATITTFDDRGLPVRNIVTNNYTNDLVSLFFDMEQNLKIDRTNLVETSQLVIPKRVEG